jgi:hypothetical protein
MPVGSRYVGMAAVAAEAALLPPGEVAAAAAATRAAEGRKAGSDRDTCKRGSRHAGSGSVACPAEARK